MITSNELLLAAIQASLGATITSGFATTSAASDIFEAYIFSIVLDAARVEGASISFRDSFGATPATLTFRTSPGFIFSKTQPYTHAIISFSGKPLLEAHLGIRVSGKSGVLHECDVAVLLQLEAETCRLNSVSPRSSKLIIGVECKFYATNIPLGLTREFIGLQTDLSAQNCFFVINTFSDSAEKLLAKRKKICVPNATPGSTVNIERLRNLFQTAFTNFKAMY